MIDPTPTLAAHVAEGLRPTLKVVVDHTMPRDELRVHPSMFGLMSQAAVQEPYWERVRALVVKEAGDE